MVFFWVEGAEMEEKLGRARAIFLRGPSWEEEWAKVGAGHLYACLFSLPSRPFSLYQFRLIPGAREIAGYNAGVPKCCVLAR